MLYGLPSPPSLKGTSNGTHPIPLVGADAHIGPPLYGISLPVEWYRLKSPPKPPLKGEEGRAKRGGRVCGTQNPTPEIPGESVSLASPLGKLSSVSETEGVPLLTGNCLFNRQRNIHPQRADVGIGPYKHP